MWRLLDSDLRDAAYTAAADEAILIARNEGVAPSTLHFYRRDAPAVSIGYFQKTRECVDLEAAAAENVSLVRRMSGGSAIYTDSGQLIYSLTVDSSEVPGTEEEAFERVCRALIDALSMLGIEATHHRPNDVLVRGRKISGSAQVRRGSIVALHGTILVDTDLDRMERVLRSAKRTAGGMTSIAIELGTAPPMSDVKSAVVSGFRRAFGTGISEGPMSDRENELTAHLVETKYSTAQHTFLR